MALGYGVMVTLQILVLSFQVRILVAQPRGLLKKRSFFCFISSLMSGIGGISIIGVIGKYIA